DLSPEVRGSCARALRGAAIKDSAVRQVLERAFHKGPAAVRAGAARGLSQIDLRQPSCQDLVKSLQRVIAAGNESRQIRHAAIWAGSSIIGNDTFGIRDTIEACLEDGDSEVRHAALHVLADAIAEGRLTWSTELVTRIESKIMQVTDPCPHLYSDLTTILAMR